MALCITRAYLESESPPTYPSALESFSRMDARVAATLVQAIDRLPHERCANFLREGASEQLLGLWLGPYLTSLGEEGANFNSLAGKCWGDKFACAWPR